MKTEFRYGRKVKELREVRSWTQEHLAMIAGVETRTIQRVEKDQTKNSETLQAIAAAFDVDIDVLRSTYRIAESRIEHTQFVSTCTDFIAAEQRYRWHAASRRIMVPSEREFQNQIEDLLGKVFADRDLIEPDEYELWRSHVEHITEPLQSIFDLGLAFYLLDEHKDLLLKPALGGVKPYKDCIDWRIRYFLLVPRHGCFCLSRSEPLHRFDTACDGAQKAALRTQKLPCREAVIYKNALYAGPTLGSENGVNWCDSCFPPSINGQRISLEYFGRVTGLSEGQLYDLCEAVADAPFMDGLA